MEELLGKIESLKTKQSEYGSKIQALMKSKGPEEEIALQKAESLKIKEALVVLQKELTEKYPDYKPDDKKKDKASKVAPVKEAAPTFVE